MSIYTKLAERMAKWFKEDRVNAIRKGGGLKPWTDAEEGFTSEHSVPYSSREVFSTKEEFEDLTKTKSTSAAIDTASPAVRAAFLSTHRKTVCQSCCSRLSKYERAALSATVSANNITAPIAAQDRLKEASQ